MTSDECRAAVLGHLATNVEGLRGVMTPTSVGVMTQQRFTVGQIVRYVGKSGAINHGAVGTVEQMHETLTTCPVVRFPDTLGPYSTFTVTRFNDLELVDPPMTSPKPADDAYDALCIRLANLQKEAGAFLGRALRADADERDRVTSRRIAEDFATEANEVADQMKAWRLANGWDK